MARLTRLVCAVILAVLAYTPANAKTVLIVTWQGKLVSEAAFENRLKELVPDVKFKYIDAKRKKGVLANQLRSMDLSGVDLVYSFGTTGTKIVQQFLNGRKPLVFNIVTAPVLSGIAESVEKPGKNTTGAQLLIDFKTQMDVLSKLRDFKTLGVWFDPREKQNTVVLKALKAIVEGQGRQIIPIRIIPDSVNGEKMINAGIAKSNKLDALYMIATSSFAGRYGKMFSGLDPKLLVMSTVSTYVESGATIALGVEFEERGRAVAEQAAKILGGANAGDIPIALVTKDKATLFVNRKKMISAGLDNLDKVGMMVKLHNEMRDD